MTQEEKIKEIIESCKLKNFAGIEGKYGDSLSLQRLEAMFLDWHTSELNRKMEEVVESLEKLHDKLVSERMASRGVVHGYGQCMEDLESLLNDQKESK